MNGHPKPATRSGCGCGGHPNSGHGCGGGCDCGGRDCGDCAPGTLVRPRFFSGQLLTEEDLRLLTDYVTAKGRLHNRHLHGSGVVCGLEVTCDPCGGGEITVHPGHAIDCCGDDIVVPCAARIDVREMVRRLRTESLGGHDCGDPCDPKRPRPVDENGRPVPEEDRPGGRRYCLWIEYCEEATDPVAPYVTGEPCGAAACEATRVREGYRFSLRCPEPEEKPDNLFDRIRACFSDLSEGEKAVSDARAYAQWGRNTTLARQRVDSEEPIRFEKRDAMELREASKGVAELLEHARAEVERVNESPEVERKAERKVERLDEPSFRAGLDSFLETSRLIVKYDLARAADDPDVFQGAVSDEIDEIDARVEEAQERVLAAQPVIRKNLALLGSQRDRLAAEAVVEQSERYAPFSNAPAPETERALFAYGAFGSDAYRSVAARDLRRLREWLLRRLDGACLTDCRLRGEAEALRIPDQRAEADRLGRTAEDLLRLVVRYLLDCVCKALNPPCPPCDDPAVLLACLEVEECGVVEICNLERTWVLSATAVRYWLPVLHKIGEGLERLCCELRHDIAVPRPRPKPVPDQIQPQYGYFEQGTPLSATIDRDDRFYQIVRVTGLSEETALSTLDLAGGLYSIGTSSSIARDSILPVLGLRSFDLRGPGVAIRERAVREVDPDELRRSVAEEVGAELGERIDTATSELKAQAEENASLVAKHERMLKSRFTLTELKRSDPVKELKESDRELERSIRELRKENAELLGRLEALEKERES